jgi:hypothetical protein
MKKHFLTILTFILILLTTTSCATIFSGSTQSVTFQSEPPQADVITVNKKGDEKTIGVTPCTVEISKKTRDIKFVKENYYAETFPIYGKARINGWYYLDLLGCLTLVGIPSTIVDISTMSIITFPETVKVELKKKN